MDPLPVLGGCDGSLLYKEMTMSSWALLSFNQLAVYIFLWGLRVFSGFVQSHHWSPWNAI